MAANSPRGFVEHRNLGGAVHTSTRLRRVKANGDSGTHQKFAGDPVVLVSGNTVARVVDVLSAAGMPILGVIRAVYDDSTYPGIRPKTHSLPSGGNFIPASTAGWVDVNEDPHQTYLVNADVTVVSTLIGQFVGITAFSPNTAAARSGFVIEVSGASNTAATVLPFQVIGIGANNLDGIVGGVNAQDVEVIIADHIWHSTNKAR